MSVQKPHEIISQQIRQPGGHRGRDAERNMMLSVLRRLLLTLCLLLALASAGLWGGATESWTPPAASPAAWYSPSCSVTVNVKLLLRTTDCDPWGAGAWRYVRRPPAPPPSDNLYGGGRLGGMRYAWVRVPLWLPTLAFALLALWLWRRGQRAKGKEFEVMTRGNSSGANSPDSRP